MYIIKISFSCIISLTYKQVFRPFFLLLRRSSRQTNQTGGRQPVRCVLHYALGLSSVPCRSERQMRLNVKGRAHRLAPTKGQNPALPRKKATRFVNASVLRRRKMKNKIKRHGDIHASIAASAQLCLHKIITDADALYCMQRFLQVAIRRLYQTLCEYQRNGKKMNGLSTVVRVSDCVKKWHEPQFLELGDAWRMMYDLASSMSFLNIYIFSCIPICLFCFVYLFVILPLVLWLFSPLPVLCTLEARPFFAHTYVALSFSFIHSSSSFSFIHGAAAVGRKGINQTANGQATQSGRQLVTG